MNNEGTGDQLAAALQHALMAHLSDDTALVERAVPLTGGASRETFAVSASRSGQPWPLILQRERGGGRRRPEGMDAEAAVVRTAHEGGVPTPQVIISHNDVSDELSAAVGNSWFVCEAVDGETIARRILRDDVYVDARRDLPRQLGSALAAVHQLPFDHLEWIEAPDELAKYREVADEMELASPAFELAFRWLNANRPAPSTPNLVHGDFRMGNLIVDEHGLSAVIDWELAHVGDPMEDLGWLCVRAWRFGGAGPVAGVGDYGPLFEGYAAASGRSVDPEVVRWWETLGTLKWGIMCGSQVTTHRNDVVRSVELAAIGRRIAEQEFDVLGLIGTEPLEMPEDQHVVETPVRTGETSVAELVEAVREFLAGDVMSATEGRVSFHARVAANALSIVERDLVRGPTLEQADREMFARFGAASRRELAQRIRSGELDAQAAELRSALHESAVGKLRITNPRWLG